jgi:hypothetical protein
VISRAEFFRFQEGFVVLQQDFTFTFGLFGG